MLWDTICINKCSIFEILCDQFGLVSAFRKEARSEQKFIKAKLFCLFFHHEYPLDYTVTQLQNFLYRRTTFSVNRSRFQHQTSTDASFRFSRNCKCVSDRKVAGICFENSKHDTPCFLSIFYFHIGFSICIFQLKNELIAFWVYKIMNEKNKFSIICWKYKCIKSYNCF